MAKRVRNLSAARRATVQITDREGTHHGQGLLLDIEGEGTVVLTCHHIIAQLQPDAVHVKLPEIDGKLGAPRRAYYDEERSRPGADAVVLRLKGVRAEERPLLHRLDPLEYSGNLDATVLTHGGTTSFSAIVSASTPIDMGVPIPDARLPPGSRYIIPQAFRLANPTDARTGISGGVVVSNAGVLGLAQSARSASETREAEVYLLPLNVWAEGWGELSALVEDFIGDVTDPFDYSLQDYLRALNIYSKNTPYLALDELLSGTKRTLSDVYVPMRALKVDLGSNDPDAAAEQEAASSQPEASVEAIDEQDKRLSEEQESEEKDKLPGEALGDILKRVSRSTRRPHVLLQGGAGTGKSTVLRHITENAWSRPHQLNLDRPHLPIVIRLQLLAEERGASLEESLLNGLRRAGDLPLERTPPSGFFNEWSKRENAPWLLMLDGLYEVPAEHRDDILRWIRDELRKLEGQHHVVLTSRPASEKQYQDLASDFSVYELLPFGEGQLADFATRWFPDTAPDFLAKIEKISAGNLFRERLVMTPLLLTIAAAVYRSNKGDLPESGQVELYSRFINILFEEAEQHGLKGELGEEITDVARGGLERLALAMTESPGDNALAALVRVSAEFLQEELGWGHARAERRGHQFIEVMSQRVGLLHRTGENFEWVHPSIREFLAAQALDRQLRKLRNDYTAVIGERLLDEGWHEVLWNLSLIHPDSGALVRWMSREASVRFNAAAALLSYYCWQDIESTIRETLRSDIVVALASGLGDSQSGLSARDRLLQSLIQMGREVTEQLLSLLDEYNGLQAQLVPEWDDEKRHPDIHTEPGKRIYAGFRLRHNVIKVLGDIGDERAVDPLITLLNENDRADSFRRDIAFGARRALRCIGLAAVGPLLARIGDATLATQARVDCLRALGVVGLRTAATTPVLDACLREGLRDNPELLARALWAAWRLHDHGHTEHAISALSSDDKYVVAEAAAYLARMPDPAGFDHLSRAFTKWLSHSDDGFVQIWNIRRLAAALLATRKPEAKKRVSDFIRSSLNDRGKLPPDDSVQAGDEAGLTALPQLLLEKLIRMLNMPAPDVVVDRLVTRLSDVWRPKETRLIIAATQKSKGYKAGNRSFAASLVDICVGDEEATESEQTHLRNYLDRKHVMRMMAKCQVPDFVAQAVRLLPDGEFWLVGEVSDALGLVGDSSAEDALIGALNHYKRPSEQADHSMPEEYDILRALGTCCTERGGEVVIHYIRENPNLSIYLPEEVLCPLVHRNILDVGTLERMAQDATGTHEYIRRACVLALGYLDAPRFTHVFLHVVASESDEQSRGYAASFLGWSKNDRGNVVRALQDLLKTDKAFLAERAAQSLVRLRERGSLGVIENTAGRFSSAEAASGLLRAAARFRAPSTLKLLETLRTKKPTHRYLHTEDEVIAAFGEFYQTHAGAREIVDAQLEHTHRGFDSGKQRIAVRVLAAHNPNSLLQRAAQLYDEDRLDSSACMALINCVPRLSKSKKVDQTRLAGIMKRLLCEDDLSIREWAGESLQFVAAPLRPRIHDELRALDSEWAQACAVYSLAFWDSNEQLIKSARFHTSSVVRHLASTAASLRSKRPALRKIVQTFRTSHGVPRLSAYFSLLEHATDSLVNTLYRDIRENDPARIYLRELDAGVERRVKEDRKKRAKEEQEAICEKVRHVSFCQ